MNLFHVHGTGNSSLRFVPRTEAPLFLVVLTVFFLLSGPANARSIACPEPSKDVELNKNEARRYFNMGNTSFNMGEFEKSIESFKCVLQLVPYSVLTRFRLGQAYEKTGRYRLAREQYKWVISDASDEARSIHEEVNLRMEIIADKSDTTRDGNAGTKPGFVPDSVFSRWWFWTGVGAVTLFGIGTVTGGLFSLRARDVWETDWRTEDRDRLNLYKNLTDLSLGATLISAAALGVAVLLYKPSPSRGTAWQLVPVCHAEGCMVSFTRGF